MAIRGKVKNGSVRLEDPKALAEGTEVEVRPVKKRGKGVKPASKAVQVKRGKDKSGKTKKQYRPGSLAERLADVIGTARGLPPDMSVNLDHYLYGLPKQQS